MSIHIAIYLVLIYLHMRPPVGLEGDRQQRQQGVEQRLQGGRGRLEHLFVWVVCIL